MSNAALPTFRFPDGTCIAQAQPKALGTVTMASPAVQVMTDLTEIRAASVHPQTSLADAERAMISQGVRMLFVVHDMPCVEGIVTVSDLKGPTPTRLVEERHVRYEELRVADVMSPLASLDAIEYASLQRATVEQIVATLRQFGRQHLLVVEDATPGTPARIRGVVSATQVQKQLDTPLHLTTIAMTFAEIERALI